MAGNLLFLAEAQEQYDAKLEKSHEKPNDYTWKISWRNVAAFLYMHGATIYGLYLLFSGQVMLRTIVFSK